MYINPGLTFQNMAAAKKQTKQDLENKIAELEAKLNKLSTQLESKPAEVKPAETAKPKPTLPKGSEVKPAERPQLRDLQQLQNQKVHYLKDLEIHLLK